MADRSQGQGTEPPLLPAGTAAAGEAPGPDLRAGLVTRGGRSHRREAGDSPDAGRRQQGDTAAQMLAGSCLQPQEQFLLSWPRQAAKVRGNASQGLPSVPRPLRKI